jgi:hypothetical protein
MIDVARTIRVIRQIETGGRPWGEPGDAGQALGPFQFHPAAFWDWSEQPKEGTTWDAWFTATIRTFLLDLIAAFPEMTPVECAVVYHQHCYIVRPKPEDMTKDDYAERFKAAWGP